MEISKSKRTWIIIGAVLMTATVQLSSAGLNNTMYAILSGMNGLQYYALLATLSSLGMAIVCVIGGRIGDMIGRRAVILAGAVLSLASAIVMGLAQSLSVFIVARAVLSFGIGTFVTNDTCEQALNIVIKLQYVNGRPVAKLSDAHGKEMCQDDEYLSYLKRSVDFRLNREK